MATFDPDSGSEDAQRAVLQQLEEFALLAIQCTTAARQALTAHQQYPDCYTKLYWQSRKAFKEHQRCRKNNIEHALPATLAPVGHKDPSDPLYIRLPEPSKDHHIMVFRLILSPSSRTYLAALFQLPTNPSAPSDAPLPVYREQTIPSEAFLGDIGYQRFQLGLCSACGTMAKLHACTGCQQQAYCSQSCQSQSWKRHKSLCRRMQFIVKKGEIDRLAAE